MVRKERRYTHNRVSAIRYLLICSTAIVLISIPAIAQTALPSPRNNYGSVGLIDMPSARMAPDGELSASAFFTDNIQRYTLGFQALPWLEADFHYSGLDHFDPLYSVYYDRSFAMKVRLWQEDDLLPAVAIGVNDLVGTGAYGGEYLVASKRFGSVDATLGIGWGRMGSTALFKNPLSVLSSSFNDRDGEFGVSTNPGATNFKTLFHGHDAGLFGGLAWSTPIEGLSLIGEYSSDAYTLESQRGAFRPSSQLNFGASYQIADAVTLDANWLYGRSVGANISFQLDPTHDPYPQRVGPPIPEARIRTPEQQQVALNTLLASRNGRATHDARRSSAFSGTGELVEKLWGMPGLSNAALQGHTLSLSLTQGDPESTCRSVARFVVRYTNTIANVNVSRGALRVRCPVDVAPNLILANISVTRGMGAAGLVDFASTPLITIDAVGRSADGDATAIASIRADVAKQRIAIHAIALNNTQATVYYSNERYFSEVSAIDRLTRILMQDAPAEIEKFRLIAVVSGQAIREYDVLRTPAERSVQQTESLNFPVGMTTVPAPLQNPILAAETKNTYPKFSYSIFPQVRQQLFDPQNPLGIQLLAGVESAVEILPGLSINGEAEASLFDTFSTTRPPSSDLPHVRTDFLKYFTEGKNGIGLLDAEYRFRISPTVFAMVRAGYLESMYAGAGGEILWRPEGQRWSLGADFFDVQKRDFDRLFGLQNYRVFTGHVSLYYSSPWYDLNFAVHAGQYLAGDRGATFEITRRFASGIEIGAFFTTTNVSAQQFGEGSFDKGIMLRIPLGWIAPIETQEQFNLDLRPVQRDGGQRLDGDTRLVYETRRTSLDETMRVAVNPQSP
jgi:hypothetical protein